MKRLLNDWELQAWSDFYLSRGARSQKRSLTRESDDRRQKHRGQIHTIANSEHFEGEIMKSETAHSMTFCTIVVGEKCEFTHHGARTHDHKVKGLALCRLS